MKSLKEIVSLDDDTVITYDNILNIGKAIALGAVKGSMRYAFTSLDKMYKNLMRDIYHHNELEPYTNSYDLVQDAVCFLCNCIGKKLGDVYGLSKTRLNRYDNVRFACYKVVYASIRKEIKLINNEVDDEILEYIEVENEVEKEPIDYLKVIDIANNIINNPLEAEILGYYYSGTEPNVIADNLNISVDKVYRSKRRFKDRYMLFTDNKKEF